MKTCRVLALFLALALLPTVGAAQQIGIVLMHGKWGTPKGPTQSLETALRGAGYRVIAREMAWSDTRAYDQTLDEAMGEIDRQVAELKAGGAQRIVVGGHSMGGSMALAYGARHPEVDGIIALAPAHTPEQFLRNPKMAQSLERARAMVAAGKGQQMANFDDINVGRMRQVSARASVYVSFFDSLGDASMPRNAARLSPHIALLVIDPTSASGPAGLFDQAPKNPHSAYRTVEADHFGTPAASPQIVLDWLKAL